MSPLLDKLVLSMQSETFKNDEALEILEFKELGVTLAAAKEIY